MSFEQIPALAERGKKRVALFFEFLDKRLSESEYVAGNYYTIADITAQVSLDFSSRAGLPYSDDKNNIARWDAQVNDRPSSKT